MNLLDLREPVSAWSHAAGLVLALPAMRLLWRRGAGDRAKRLSLFVYGLSLALCFGASALYHGVRVDGDRLGMFSRLDHLGIFALIAGSYTPIAWTLLAGRWRRWTLRLAWLAAVGGTLLHWSCGHLPIALSTALYLAMGWGAVFCYAELARVYSHRTLRLILVGGVLYSGGAVLNLLRWPILWEGVFGAHELFHLFVLAGSLAHFTFILRVVAPATSGTATRAPALGTRPAPAPGDLIWVAVPDEVRPVPRAAL